MTRDYAKKARPKPAAVKAKPAPKSQIPGWVWLFTGTVLGAFIMFLAYLSGLTPQSSSKPFVSSNPAKEPAPTSIPKPRFDFYQILKETEVTVQEPAAPAKSTAAAESIEFLLQVGSFKKENDADRLRAELILLNLSAYVEKVTVRNGETWYRVLVGPFDNHSKLASARSTLVSNDISPLVLKRKKSN